MITRLMSDYQAAERLVDDMVGDATEPTWAAVVEVFSPGTELLDIDARGDLWVVDHAGRAYLERRFADRPIEVQYESTNEPSL